MRILHVDDSPDDSFLFEEMIRDAFGTDCELTHETRLREALIRFEEVEYDVALVDIGLPDSQGEETVETVLSASNHVPVLFLTGNEDEQLAMAAVSKGAQDYLLKNEMTPALLARAIRYAMERQQMERRMRQMEKMEAVGQLAGGIAHDFNNQLAAIMTCADMLSLNTQDEKNSRYVENIITAAKRSADLIRQLLAFSRKSYKQNIPVDLHHIIREVAGILSHSFDRRIRIRQDLRAENIVVSGDPSQLQSAIMNLGINARDAMPEGGTLTFRTRERSVLTEASMPGHAMLAPGHYLELQVEDTGCGMPLEVRKRIFEPFYTTKEVGKGTGMGLAAVSGTIEQHHGCISVDSTENEGTCFTVALPLMSAPSSAPSEVASKATPVVQGHILVIDDEPILRAMLTEVIVEIGATAHVEADGAAAVAYYREHWQEVDLVMLDVIMPTMSGIQVLDEIRAVNPQALVLVMSGYSTSADLTAIRDKGVACVLEKPFQFDTLAQTLCKVLAPPQT